MVNLIITGSIGLDDIKTPFGEIKNTPGGTALYAAYAASFFSKPGLIGIIGGDFPEQILQMLKKRGIDLSGVEVKQDGRTFRWNVLYEFNLNDAKTLGTELNVLEGYVPKLPIEYSAAKFLLLANNDPDVQLQTLKQMRAPEFVVADTMNFWIERKRESLIEVIRRADALVLNDAEARMLFYIPNLVLAAKKIMQLGPRYVIIKKGEHGALLFTREESNESKINGIKIFNAPGYPLENVIDPSGAGDSFAGAFIGYLASTKELSEANIRKAVIYGSTVASYNAEGFGLNNLRMINKDDIEKRFKEFRELREF